MLVTEADQLFGPRADLVQVVEQNFDHEERKFFGALDTELARIVQFYEEREAEYAARFELITRQLKEVSYS